ncbi:MAG: LysM peptidoglycan-binding domain-containing protein [Candidatus Limnocylindrales bacterium]
MALRLLVVWLVGLSLAGCVPTPPGRATTSPAATSAGSSASAEVTVMPSVLSTAGPTGSPSFVRPTPKPSPTFLVYEVRAGDTLTSVARQFGTTARSVAYWNRSRYPSLDPDSPTYQPGLIKVGWLLLVIPTAVVDEDELPGPTPEPTPVV